MKILVSTKKGQGLRKNDFCDLPEGEIVVVNSHNCTKEKPDGKCGCKRSMDGVRVVKGEDCFGKALLRGRTTTMMVVNNPKMTEKKLLSYILSWEKKNCPEACYEIRDMKCLTKYGDALDQYPVGKVLEFRGNKLEVRIIKSKAKKS